MATLTTSRATGGRSWLSRHPLTTFFALAYGLAWVIWLPLLIMRNGYHMTPAQVPFWPFVVGVTLCPTIAALLATGALEGRAGMRQFFARYRPTRVSGLWYVLIIGGLPLAFLLGSSVALGVQPWQHLAQRLPLFFNAYPLLFVVELFQGPFGEEPGWRGFALPRLQQSLGPVGGSVMLGLLWAFWHTPLFFLSEWSGTIPHAWFIPAFVGWIVPFTIIMTWLYNRTRGNLFMMILTHDALNSTIALIALGALIVPNDLFLQSKLWWPIAVILILATRGQLGYAQERLAADRQAEGDA